MGRQRRAGGDRLMTASRDSGRRIPMVVPFLEMTAKPAALPPPIPRGKVAIMRAVHPPVHFYRYLYDTIGDAYFWVDRRKLSDAALGTLIQDSEVELHVLYLDGNPAGM